MRTHLKDLVAEHLGWQGYIVKQDIPVDNPDRGVQGVNLGIVAYHPTDHFLLQVEANLDAAKWEEREERFKKKFDAGKQCIFEEVFSCLKGTDTPPLRQMAFLINRSPQRETIAGRHYVSIDEYITIIRDDVRRSMPVVFEGAIPENYPLLRTIQFLVRGHSRGGRDPKHPSKIPDDFLKVLSRSHRARKSS